MSELIAGVDEAGVCPIAGPVVAAAVILNPAQKIYKLRDSKILSAKQRDELYEKIVTRALAFSVGIASVEEIDTLNIFHANMLAMARAIEGLQLQPHKVLIDGRATPKQIYLPMQAIVGGDRKIKCISAASIIAKVTRDRIMQKFHLAFPNYHFDKHKGYPTKLHQQCLQEFGACDIHRRSFARVRERMKLAVIPV
jgi:ribonuclease HII